MAVVPAPRVVLLPLGEELLQGRVQDANSPWLAREVLALGGEVRRILVLGDEAGELAGALADLAGRCELVVTTGGLGPTADDRVRREVAALLGVPLVDVPGGVPRLAGLWRRQHGGEAPVHFLDQARVPRGARPLANRAGTAWGFASRLPDGRHLLCLPGPPGECRAAFLDGGGREEVARLCPGSRGGVLLRTLHVAGLPETAVETRIRDLLEGPGNPRFGSVAGRRQVTVSILARPEGDRDGAEILEEAAAEVRRRLGALVWGADEETLPGVVVGLLRERRQTVVTAESCTGGRLAAALTSVPGASEVFLGGWVAYADAVKVRELGVAEALLREHGAVSEAVARAMAAGARERAGADHALAVTGIAGPGGGSLEKPVGTVWLGVAGPGGVWAVHRRAYARAGRTAVQEQSVRDALEALRRELLGLERLPERR